MTTRRQLLAGAAGLGFLAACKSADSTEGLTAASTGTHQMVLANHDAGLGVVNAGTGKWVIPPARAVLPLDRSRLASVDGQRLAIWSLPAAQRTSESKLDGAWTPYAMVGDNVALVRKIESPKKTTSIHLLGPDRRFNVPGDVEPEAFSPDGSRLYLLDYLPDAYRVRVLDTATGQVARLNIKDKGEVPADAEERMNGKWKHAVFDAERGMLFSLYLHHGDHQHTGQLLGVRPDAPGVFAFIHALHLAEGWAVCIDLPRPFGYTEPGDHTLVLGKDLYAVNAADGALARINREDLSLMSVDGIPQAQGPAHAVIGGDGRPVIAAGKLLSDTRSEWSLPHELHGLARSADGLLWTATPDRLVALDFAGRRQVHDIAVPGLRSVIDVV